jgi:tungstate transport system substrate-binding protein
MFVVMLPIIISCDSSTASPLAPQSRLRVATTTSLYDTGLWSYLEPMFEEEYEVELDVISAGTGAALEYGRRGDVDVITVHSKIREEEFVGEGYGIERIPFAYNYFLVVGPPDDPAGIQGMTPQDAFMELFETGTSSFISRGDDSGTHIKEKSIWEVSGYNYESVKNAGQWYIEGGRGMGPTLLMASEKQGYTLTDMGTFLSYKGQISLVPIVDRGSILLNVYSVIVCNPDNNPNVAAEMGNNIVQFLISADIQELIGNYGVDVYGMQLFIPCAGNEPSE